MNRKRFLELFEQADRESIPLKVVFELTYRCNFRCQHCYIPEHQAPVLLPTTRLLDILEELRDLGALFLGLTGGELFLRKDWYVIARRARQLGFYVTLLTNGVLIDEPTADLIDELGLVVHISFFSTDDQIFSQITGQPDSLSRVKKSLELLSAREVPVTLKVPLMQANRNELQAIEAFAERYDFEVQAFSRLSATTDGSMAPAQLRLGDSDLDTFYRSTLPLRPEVVSGTKRPAGDSPLCAAGARLAVITPAGRVLPCPSFPHSAGDLNTSSFTEIWHDAPLFRELRSLRRFDIDVCNTCSKYDMCSRCPAQALIEDGDLRGPSSEACIHAAAVERVIEDRRS